MSLTQQSQNSLSRDQRVILAQLLEEKARRKKYNAIKELFPEKGDLRRELYPKHLEFFTAGKAHKERLFMAGNRVGKTVAGGAEVVYHMTGDYPHWWTGFRFSRPVRVLVAGDTAATTRDILQEKLFGSHDDIGSGLIPKKSIITTQSKMGVAKALESARIAGEFGRSTIMMRSYDQGRRIFQGFEADIIWFDEEVPEDVYSEALVRLMTTNGLMIMTYTPINGLTPLTVSFLETANLL